MDFQLQDKVALITGSSSGIGIGIAHALAAEGVSVVVHGRDVARTQKTADAINAKGGKAKAVNGDLDTDEGADSVAKAAEQCFGRVDILINNAGGRVDNTLPVSFFDIPPHIWTATYNRNVTSAVRLIHKLVPQMKERGWGRVIMLGSFSGQATSGGVAEYAATKAALPNVALGLSKALANTGVTFNTVSPGMIHTEALGQWLEGVAQQQGYGNDREKAVRWVLDNTMKQTVDRLGQVEDIGYATVFLCSPRGDFINGANLRVCGGASPAVN